jgi:hypothetical protein
MTEDDPTVAAVVKRDLVRDGGRAKGHNVAGDGLKWRGRTARMWWCWIHMTRKPTATV